MLAAHLSSRRNRQADFAAQACGQSVHEPGIDVGKSGGVAVGRARNDIAVAGDLDEGAVLIEARPELEWRRPAALARQSLGIFLADRTGFYKNLRLDEQGAQMVLALRSKFAGRKLADPAKYVDPAYREKALA